MAASTNEQKAELALNTCRSTILWNNVAPANGPHPFTDAHTPIPVASSAAEAAPRWRNRHAAHQRNGNTRYWMCRALWNRRSATSTRPTYRIPASTRRWSEEDAPRRRDRKDRRNGATTSTPMASPVHHTDQVDQKAPGRRAPERRREAVPPVALTAMPRRAARTTKATASRSRASSARNPILRKAVAA